MSAKRTCDACVASKVKCSGGHPCTRCSTRNVDCFYRARKKRLGSKMKQQMLEAQAAQAATTSFTAVVPRTRIIESDEPQHKKTHAVESAPQKGMAQFERCVQSKAHTFPVHERVAWSVFFTLYKNYRTECCSEWFLKQFARLSEKLKCTKMEDFMRWLNEDATDLGSTRRLEDCNVQGTTSASFNPQVLPFHATGGKVCSAMQGKTLSLGTASVCVCIGPCSCGAAAASPSPALAASPSAAGEEMRRLFLSNFDQVPSLTIHVADDESIQVAMNDKFSSVFGVQVMEPFGLLPWGADALCYVVPNEADIVAFLQVGAINFPDNLCEANTTRTVPSTHTPQVLLGTGQTVPCLIKCVHTYTLTADNVSSLEVYMTFEPVLSGTTMFAEEDKACMLEGYLPLTDMSLSGNLFTFQDISSPSDTSSSSSSSIGGGGITPQDEELKEMLFPELDFALEDNLFFSELFDFAKYEEGGGLF